MKRTRHLILAALAFTAFVLAPTAAAAVEYPWCLIRGGRAGSGAWSCGYVSFEQCMATRIGTDMCNINPRYPYASAQPRKVKRARAQ